MVKYDKLQPLIPEIVYLQLLDVCAKYNITTSIRLSHFLAQCSHESGGFKRVEENLNYSADRLLAVFPKYFTPAQVTEYARDKVRIASRVYANRLGNGDELSQDGWAYRGRGYIQLTGKSNYGLYNKVALKDVLTNPDLVSTDLALDSAGWYWDRCANLNAIADLGVSSEVIGKVTKKVNGGLIGFNDRVANFNKFY